MLGTKRIRVDAGFHIEAFFVGQILSVKGGEAGIMRSAGADSPGKKSPQHTVRMPTKHIIGVESIAVCKTLGIGEFGTVQQGIWTNEDGERVSGVGCGVGECGKGECGV